ADPCGEDSLLWWTLTPAQGEELSAKIAISAALCNPRYPLPALETLNRPKYVVEHISLWTFLLRVRTRKRFIHYF
ncbi:MAG TPA: hypothetical protein P5086_10590, partial [Prolixibacteraceae bacterium]|nr:hypothetical protein [Prolixibacteraceae bacterium]